MDEGVLLPLDAGQGEEANGEDSDSSSSNERDEHIENGIVNDEDPMSESSSPPSDAGEEEDVMADGEPQNSPPRRPSTRSSQNSEGSNGHHHHHYRPRTVSYDKTLPAQHSYLGNDLEELSGRVVMDDESYITLPLLSLPGLVLVPGQTLPLQFQHPSLVGMMQKIIEKDRTFGLTFSEGSIGTTVEIRSYGTEGDDDIGLGIFRVKAEGRQRFTVIDTWRQADGILMGKVKVLSEINLTSQLERNTLLCPYGPRLNSKLLPACTRWPKFVYDMYDANFLMDAIKRHLENWVSFESSKATEKSPERKGVVKNTQTHVSTGSTTTPGAVVRTTRTVTTTIRTRDPDEASSEEEDNPKNNLTVTRTKAPSKPCEFSYWVAANLPLQDSRRIEFLSLNCSIQRLRWLLSVLQKYLYLCCCNCRAKICHKDDVFSMSVEGPQNAYVNPAGCVHETLTVYKTESLSLEGRPSTEFSWFPGFAWTICSCSHCHSHIGWRFTATNKKLQPEFFWGITRSAVEFGLKTDKDDVDWRPVI